jgi:hypothetical protein
MAQTRQTIQNFYTQSQQKDFARLNLFRVLNIDFGDGSDVSFNEDDLVYATTASLPNKEITSNTVPYMGFEFRVPGVVKYPGGSGYTLRFRCDENYDLRNRFLQVMNDTFDDSDSTGNYFIPNQNSVLDLALLDKELNRVSQFQLVGIAPTTVGDIQYDVTGDGAIAEFDVTVSYHFFRQTA